MSFARRPVPTARRIAAWAITAALFAALSAAAQSPVPAAAPAQTSVTAGPAWTSLAPAQQRALAPLQRDWASMNANQRAKWLEIAARLPTIPSAEQQRIQQRMAEWSRLSPAERGRARLQFQELRQLSPSERQTQWEAYQALPEETRRELAQRAKPAAPARPANTAQAVQNGGAKRNVVAAPRAVTAKPVTPAVVQSKPGATTTLLTQPATPPIHQQTGLPKIAATEGFVNPSTLLPKRGPQGAAALRSAAAPTPPSSQP